ncbi:50S ribosomal protein L22 [Candidatus Uhrbacteria bacterium]|nr:50S ribosomal protein L22 [Candidatus Uhrbacteria bacterium]
MTANATLRRLRMSPRKVRLLVDLVRGMDVDPAIAQLRFSQKLAARPVRKLIESAAANAVNNHHMNRGALFIQTIYVDQGATTKRWTPRAFGRATSIRKRTCHLSVVLAERLHAVKGANTSEAATKADAPKKRLNAKASPARTYARTTKSMAAKRTTSPRTKRTSSKKPE